jgi:hypothetical protein
MKACQWLLILWILAWFGSTINDIYPFLREDAFNVFGEIQEMSHFVAHLAMNTTRLPQIMWYDNTVSELHFDRVPLSIPAFWAMYVKVLRETTSLLHENVLLNLQLPDLHYANIIDNLSNIKPGYLFIWDPRNDFTRHNQFLLWSMLDHDLFKDRFGYQMATNAHGIVWNMAEVQKWIKTCEKCLGNMFALYHLGSGQLARGTEITLLSLVNTSLHPQNLYWISNHLSVITLYNKT